MISSKNFIFYDNSNLRWDKIKRISLKLFIIFEIILFFVFASLIWEPRFSESLFEKYQTSTTDIVNQISEVKEDEINVSGVGYDLDLVKKNEEFLLNRLNPVYDQKKKYALLTFDDGPDPEYTPKILEILNREKVPGVFFVLGGQIINHPNMLNKILEGGNELGVHTYSHVPEGVDLNKEKYRADIEIDFTQKAIISETGIMTKIFRVPYWGSEDTISLNTLILSIESIDKGYKVVPPNVDSQDWLNDSKQNIVSRSLSEMPVSVILLHDAGGDRTKTVESLGEIINKYKSAGYEFATFQQIYGDSDSVMASASWIDRLKADVAVGAFVFHKKFLDYFTPLFELNLGMVTVYTATLMFLAILSALRYGLFLRRISYKPKVTVIIAAHNEENVIGKSIDAVLKSDYNRLEIIIVNNNSTDRTYSVAKKYIKKGKVRLLNEPTIGKNYALNKALRYARGTIIVALDADTLVTKNTILEIVKPFKDKRVGAVSGNLKIGNKKNLLTWLQHLEYTIGLNIERRAFSLFGASLVIPGAVGAWRKNVLLKLGGYKNDTLTEDADITIRVQLKGYRVVYSSRAVAYTEAPSKLSAFIKQRYRWTYGMLQIMYKYRKYHFGKKSGLLTRFILPFNALLILPFSAIAPFFDAVALYLIWVGKHPVLKYVLVFLILYLLVASTSFVLAGEKNLLFLLLIPFYRTIYQFIWYFVLYKSITTALKGVFVPWSKSIHYGRFKLYEKISGEHLSIDDV